MGLAFFVMTRRPRRANLFPNATPARAPLIGGDGNDVVSGGRGNDTALLGNGNDTFIWNPGDGSDIVEGQAGTDTLLFNGSNLAENIDISANRRRDRESGVRDKV